jgi:hypothetical protein
MKTTAATATLRARPAANARETAVTSEWWFVAATIAVLLAVTSLPYIYAYATTPPDHKFLGIMLDVPDHAQYFSWMRELATSNLASNKLTPEANSPVFFNLLWWLMGHLGAWFGLGFAAMLQALRFVAGTLFLIVAYRVCSWFIADRTQRRVAFLILALTSGFGWVLVVAKYTLSHGTLLRPMDLFTAEGNTFLGILGYPHFIAAALFIVVFDLVLRGEARSRWSYSVAAGLIAFFLGWQHAYDLVSVYGVLLAYFGFRWLADRKPPRYVLFSGLIIGAISVWPAVYSVWLTRADPVWKGVLAQFANAGVFTPPPLDLIILLGPAFLLAIFELIRRNPLRMAEKSHNELFLQAWFLATFGLVYLPVDFQVHLINGWQVPIALLATSGLYQGIIPWIARLRKPASAAAASRRQSLAAIALIIAILPTNVYLLAWRFVDLSRHDYPFYILKDDSAALTWLDTHIQPDDVVLSSLTIGQLVPAWTGAHAFLGHWAETLDFFQKSDAVQKFYDSATSDSQRAQLLRQFGVSYVYFGTPESAIGSYDPNASSFLALVYANPHVQLYRVRLP